MPELKTILELCKNHDQVACRQLYELYRTPWFMTCQRYFAHRSDALDALQNGLVNVFTKLSTFDSQRGEFADWSRRIMVNDCIMILRKRNPLISDLDGLAHLQDMNESSSVLGQLSAEEITKMIQKLPNGYRVVFNLSVIEGYTHQEIGDMLGISPGTSKSQLSKAKNLLRQKLEVII